MNNHLDPYGFMIPEIFYEDGVIPPPPVIRDGSTVAWFLSDEPTTITSVANRVSRWNDYLGSGHDLIQANGADQPLWSANGILFDGINEFMKCGAFVYVQPEMIYIVIKHITWTNFDAIFDGNISDRCELYQSGVFPGLKVYAGVNSAQNNNLILDTWGIIRVLFNGAASTFQINETAAIAGNFGALGSGGFTLAAYGSSLIRFSNIEVKEIILRNVADAAGDEAAIYAYLAAKYGI